MKIEKHTPTPQFKPISITITIETEEELIALQTISRFNVSIPELLSDERSQEIVYDFLGMIHNTITD